MKAHVDLAGGKKALGLTVGALADVDLDAGVMGDEVTEWLAGASTMLDAPRWKAAVPSSAMFSTRRPEGRTPRRGTGVVQKAPAVLGQLENGDRAARTGARPTPAPGSPAHGWSWTRAQPSSRRRGRCCPRSPPRQRANLVNARIHGPPGRDVPRDGDCDMPSCLPKEGVRHG